MGEGKFLVAGMLAVALACGSSQQANAQPKPQPGGTAVFTLTQDPPNVNPDVTTGLANRQIGCVLLDGLVDLSNDYRILPALAKSWTISPDGLTYSFELEKTKWHDGKPFTAEDVRYSLVEVAAKYSAVFGPAGRLIQTVDTSQPDKVVIKLSQPFGPFLVSLTCPQGSAILPSHLFQGTNPLQNPFNTQSPVGTGPFKLVEWKRGQYIRMEKNRDYRIPGKPLLDELVAKIISQPAAAVQALQAGEVDAVQSVQASYVATVKADPKLKVETSDIAPLTTMAFLNVKRKPLDDMRVRQALYMALDREYIFKNAFFGLGAVAVAPWTTEIKWAVNPEIDLRKQYPFDVAKANALLDEAGVKRGADGKRFALKFVIYNSEYPEFVQVSSAMKSMWGAVGVDVDIESMETATLIKRVFEAHDFDVVVQSYSSYGDPSLGIARSFISSSIGKNSGNAGSYSNAELDALFAKGEGDSAFEARGKYYKEAAVILARELPVLPLRQLQNNDAATKRLHDVWGTVQGFGTWTHAWLEK